MTKLFLPDVMMHVNHRTAFHRRNSAVHTGNIRQQAPLGSAAAAGGAGIDDEPEGFPLSMFPSHCSQSS